MLQTSPCYSKDSEIAQHCATSMSIGTIMPQPARPESSLSLGVSIVLYRTRVQAVMPLIQQLFAQGARKLYLVDNSPVGFNAFEGWNAPDNVYTLSLRRNLGYGRANNLAIRDSVSRHRYHLICNPDITLGEGLLGELYGLMEQRPDVGLCGPRIIAPDGSLQYLCKRAPTLIDLFIRRFLPANWFPKQRRRYEMRDYSYDREMEPLFVSGCFMFFRSSILGQLDGFDERYFLYLEDLDLSRRCQKIARNLYYPHNHVVHVHERGAHKSLKLLLIFGLSTFKYFMKWGPAPRSTAL